MQVFQNSRISVIKDQTFDVPNDFNTVQEAVDWLGSRPNQDCTITLSQHDTGTDIVTIDENHFLGNLTIKPFYSFAIFNCGRGISIYNCASTITLERLIFNNNSATTEPMIDIFAANVKLDNVRVLGTVSPANWPVQIQYSEINANNLEVDCLSLYGIYVNSSEIELSDSTVNSSESAILLKANSVGSIINSTTNLSSSSSPGIDTVFSHLSTDGANINNGKFGLVINASSSATINNTSIANTSTEGARIDRGSAAIIDGSTFTNPGNYGIRVLRNGVLNELSNTFINSGVADVDPNSTFSTSSQIGYRMN